MYVTLFHVHIIFRIPSFLNVGLVNLFDGVSTFVCYLMPKSCRTIKY